MQRRHVHREPHLQREIVGFFALALLFFAPFSCSHREERPPNILLIVLDTLRADRLGSYGNLRGLTPFLDELATSGIVFQNAYAPSSWTCPSVASLFTSRYPSQHHVVSFSARLAEQERTLTEALKAHGYHPGGFSANFRISEQLGYTQGFDEWKAYLRDPESGEVKPSGRSLRSASLNWLDGLWNPGAQEPIFLYLQYMEPHPPYLPAQPYRGRFQRSFEEPLDPQVVNDKLTALLTTLKGVLTNTEVQFLESLYDGETASLDAELRVLFTALDTRHFLDHAIVVITSDHGEEFKEHGGMGHGSALYNETIRVPLILLTPFHSGGNVFTENVSLLDIAPTMLDLLDLPPEPTFEGRSLLPILEPALLEPRARSSQTAQNGVAYETDVFFQLERVDDSASDLRRGASGIIRGSRKLLIKPNGTGEAYDLAQDPTEKHPHVLNAEDDAQGLRSALDALTARLARVPGAPAERQSLSEADKDRLRALGYAH